MSAAVRTDEHSDAPLRSFSGRAAETGDCGATLAGVLGLTACAVSGAAWLTGRYVRDWDGASVVCVGALLLSAATGFYAVQFAVGALANGTRERARAVVGLITGPLPALSIAWVLREAMRWT